MYGSTEGTVGLINTQNKVGAIGFVSRFIPFLPVTLIKLDKNGDPIRDARTGLCVHCKPGEEGEVIGLVRPDDRGGPEKFQVYQKLLTSAQCLKITEKVSYNIASEASYVYILSGQKLIKNAKNGQFW